MKSCLRIASLAFAAALMFAAGPPSRLTVITYNIRHGMGLDNRVDLERTAAVIRAASPDLVAVQEVDRGTERAGGADQARELGRLTGMQAVFGRAIDFQGGEYGVTVLSRLPVAGSRVHPLPGEEPRALLEVRLKAGAQEVVFFSTHLDATRPETLRKAAAEKIRAIAAELGGTPAILAGDLNTVPEREALKVLASEWEPAGGWQERPTVPAQNPRRQIDWILFRPAARWRTVEIRVPDGNAASDHRPVLAVLELVPR